MCEVHVWETVIELNVTLSVVWSVRVGRGGGEDA